MRRTRRKMVHTWTSVLLLAQGQLTYLASWMLLPAQICAPQHSSCERSERTDFSWPASILCKVFFFFHENLNFWTPPNFCLQIVTHFCVFICFTWCVVGIVSLPTRDNGSLQTSQCCSSQQTLQTSDQWHHNYCKHTGWCVDVSRTIAAQTPIQGLVEQNTVLFFILMEAWGVRKKISFSSVLFTCNGHRTSLINALN